MASKTTYDMMNPTRGRSYEKEKAGAAGGAQMGLQTALAGAAIGAAVSGPAAPIGAVIGAGVGFVAGAIPGWISSSRQYSEAQKLARKQAKIAKEAAAAQKKAGIVGSGAEQTARAYNAAAQMPSGGVGMAGSGSSSFDQYHARTYGG